MKKPRITNQEIERINFQWFVNQNNITAIGRMMKRAPGTCEKYLFKTRAEWEKWSENNK